jgi:hypothetical protein
VDESIALPYSGYIRSHKGEDLHVPLMGVLGQPNFPATAISSTKIVSENLNGTIKFRAGDVNNADEILIEVNGGKTKRAGRRVCDSRCALNVS